MEIPLINNLSNHHNSVHIGTSISAHIIISPHREFYKCQIVYLYTPWTDFEQYGWHACPNLIPDCRVSPLFHAPLMSYPDNLGMTMGWCAHNSRYLRVMLIKLTGYILNYYLNIYSRSSFVQIQRRGDKRWIWVHNYWNAAGFGMTKQVCDWSHSIFCQN